MKFLRNYLDFSSLACLIGVISRTIKFYGKTRPDMGPNCPERISLGFYKDAFLYNGKFRKKYYGIMKEHPEIEWVLRTGYPSWMQEKNESEERNDAEIECE